jgi:hypothetical protein
MEDAPPKVRRGPGLAKSRDLPLFLRGGERIRTLDARWRALLESADLMSEGDARNEKSGRVWYGSTSMLLEIAGTDEERAFYVGLAESDVHVRTRALRTAHREAQSRAPGLLGKMIAEFRVSLVPGGLRIDVEVQAPLIERRRRQRSPGG